MKTLCSILLLSALAIGLQFAQAAEKKEKPLKIGGEITAIAEDSVTITPQAKKKKKDQAEAPEAVTISISDSTKVTIDGEEKTVSDLAEGSQAVVMYTGSDEKVATMITVGKAAKAEKPKKEKKPKKGKKNDDDEEADDEEMEE